MSQTAPPSLATVVVHSPPHAYIDSSLLACKMSVTIGIGTSISINLPSLFLLRITFPRHFLLLCTKHCLFHSRHAVENIFDSWCSHLKPSRCSRGGILNTQQVSNLFENPILIQT